MLRTRPRPTRAPTSSAATSVVHAACSDSRNPVKIIGAAAGTRISITNRRRGVPSMRAASMIDRSMARTPENELITEGTKAANQITMWADDVPSCPVEVRGSEIWVQPTFGHADLAAHWRRRLDDGLAHDLGLVIAKAVYRELAAAVPPANLVGQIALYGARNRDGWGVGLTILTALGNLRSVLPEDETYLALFHGARRVATDCAGQAPRHARAPLAASPDFATLKRWLRRWPAVRHREAAERPVLPPIAAGAP